MFTILILKKRDEATTIKIILIFTSCNSFVGVGPFLNCTKQRKIQRRPLKVWLEDWNLKASINLNKKYPYNFTVMSLT